MCTMTLLYFLNPLKFPIGIVVFLPLLCTEGSFQLVPIATLTNANETAAS